MMFPASIDLADLDGSNGFAINGVAAGDISGASVSNAGDVNGDGIDDIVIGAEGASSNGLISGASFVVFGSSAGFGESLELSALDGANGFRIDGLDAYDHSGASVSGAGDINGDGFDDLIIGAPDVKVIGSYNTVGASYVIFGSAAGFPADLDLSALDGSNGFTIDGIVLPYSSSDTGRSVSGAGDVNGDGIDDLIVGAPGASDSFVVFGSTSGFAAHVDLAALDGSDGFALTTPGFIEAGDSVSGAGDVNGDGIDDLIVGARSGGPTGTFAGSSYVVFGSTDAFAASLDLSTLDGSNGFELVGADRDRTGTAVSGAGDINGDGFADLIVGAYFNRRSYVVFGAADGFAPSLDLSSMDGQNGFTIDRVAAAQELVGFSVSAAGDINDDGIDDLIIGSGASSYILFGTAVGFGSSVDLASLDGNNGFKIEGAGNSVSAAGDVNGDGIDDLVVGEPNTSPDGRAYAGASYVVFGRLDDPQTVIDGDGNSVIEGGGNDDTLSGGGGDDQLIGLRGNDVLDGGTGNDRLVGNAGEDFLTGGKSNDRLDGGDDADRLYGGAGDDRLLAGRGDDRMNGGSGNDLLYGQTGDDLISGSAGSDTVYGGAGNDKLHGFDGDDILLGGAGIDVLTGGEGTDHFVYTSLADRGDRIIAFETGAGGDVIDVSRLLRGFAEGAAPAGFVNLDERGSHTYVQIDLDGGGDRFIDMAILKFVSGLSLDRFVADGNIELIGG